LFAVTDTEIPVALHTLAIAPAQVVKAQGAVTQLPQLAAQFGASPLIVGGQRALSVLQAALTETQPLNVSHFNWVEMGRECSESALESLKSRIAHYQADVLIGVGGGKSLDLAKLAAYQCQRPIITIPTTAATCAAWTALSNIYSEQGAFSYDVGLPRCPNLLVLDYDLIRTAPRRTLVAGVGDAIAKWYEASVSSGHLDYTLTIAAVQQARVLRDILFQKTLPALAEPGSAIWREVVDASVLMAGVTGGLGGAQCRTVAAHAVHNGLTHLLASHGTLHGEKVAYGILVQLRLEELVQGSQLARSSRQQLLDFYTQVGLPRSLDELGLEAMTLQDLRTAANVAIAPQSDIHRLPFSVTVEQLMAAMVSTQDLTRDRRLSRDAAYPVDPDASWSTEVAHDD
jgi:glycerol dehydrogenase-like iron-containing ADH family enzyme